jgi:hypothetical protein
LKSRLAGTADHERGGANLYADLGYKAAGEMLVKATGAPRSRRGR